jgi:hypothetical protein
VNTEELEIEGAKVPLCGISTLIETKKGIKPKAKEDLFFPKGKMEYLARKDRNHHESFYCILLLQKM